MDKEILKKVRQIDILLRRKVSVYEARAEEALFRENHQQNRKKS